jgi:hypothetical protein
MMQAAKHHLNYRIVFVAFLVAGCGRGPKAGAPSDTTAPTTLGAAAPGQFSDLAPGDTAGVVSMMRDVMRGIDAGTDRMTMRDTTIATDTMAYHYTLWLEDGVPRKLIAIDSLAKGGSNSEVSVWFLGGDVAVVLAPADAYAMDAGRIVLWTDESLVPRTDVTDDLMMARQSTLIDNIGGWLKIFGLSLP